MDKRAVALLGSFLVLGLSTCSSSALVVDTCGPLPGDADRLQVSGTLEDAAMSRTAASAASRSARRTARRSTWISASGGTMLGRVPPRTTPTFAVTPGQRPFSAWIAWTL